MADMNMPKIPVWGWIAIAVGAILLLRPRASVGQGQGPATPMGSLGQADMGMHLAVKTPGSSGVITINWTGLTRDSRGVGISWRYKLRAVFNGAAVANFTFNSAVSLPILSPFNLAVVNTLGYTVPLNATVDDYNVTVFLQGEGSDAGGNPTGVFTDIPGAFLTHFNAITLPLAAGAAVPAGSIGSVNVSQAMARAAQRFLQ